MTVAELLAGLDELAPLNKAAGWDVVGLQIGDPAAPVSSAAVCHDVTAAVLSSLPEECDVVVAYHPLLFRPVRRLVSGDTPGGRALALAAAGRSLIIVHTAFDVAAGGAADALAEAVGLSDVSGFAPLWGGDATKVTTFSPAEAVDAVVAAMSAAGAGTIGLYTGCAFHAPGTGRFTPAAGADPAVGEPGEPTTAPEERIEMTVPASRLGAVAAALVAAHPYEEPAFDVTERRGDAGMVGRIGVLGEPISLDELAQRTADAVDFGALRVAGDRAAQVQRVAVVPGSGSDFAGEAAAAGADVLITGDVSHHRALDAVARGVAVIDAGHAPTEKPGLGRLYAAVSDMIPAVDLSGIAEPWS